MDMRAIRQTAWIAAGISMLSAGLCLADDPALARERTSPGKPTAPIELSYSVPEAPSAGSPLTIELEVSSRIRADSLALELNFPDSGLTPVSTSGMQSVAEPVAGEWHTRRVRVLPREEGAFHVNVVATLFSDGAAQARAFSIPIRVGNAPPVATEARGRLNKDEAGRALISMPAMETGTGL